MAYNWFSGAFQQHVTLRNGSGYHWAINGVSAEQSESPSCLTSLDAPDFAQLQRMNEGATSWETTGPLSAALDNATIALRALYNGEPYRISATRDGGPLNRPTILRVGNASWIMQLGIMRNLRDQSRVALGNLAQLPVALYCACIGSSRLACHQHGGEY